MCVGTHGPLPLLLLELLAQPEELLVLARHKVDGSVFQQRRKDEEEAHGHPDVDGFHVGHLRGGRGGVSEAVTVCQG